MCRWTNPLPYFVSNVKFLEKDPAHIAEWMQPWHQMRDDYERNKVTGKFENNMTDVYFPYDTAAPTGYGLVVLDMMDNKIYSSQGYTSFDTIHAFMARRDNSETFERALALYRSGHITRVEQRNNARDWAIEPVKNEKHFLQLIDQDHFGDSNRSMPVFLLDLHPFELLTFSDHKLAAAQKMRLTMISNGWEFTSEDELAWQDWFKDLSDIADD